MAGNLTKDYIIRQLNENAIDLFRKFEKDTNNYYDAKIKNLKYY